MHCSFASLGHVHWVTIGVVEYGSVSGMCGVPSVRVLLKRAIARRSMSPVATAIVVVDVTVVIALLVRVSYCRVSRRLSSVGLWCCSDWVRCCIVLGATRRACLIFAVMRSVRLNL